MITILNGHKVRPYGGKGFAHGQTILIPSGQDIAQNEYDECKVVGIDPIVGKWVVACADWVMGISHLEDEDYKGLLEVIEE